MVAAFAQVAPLSRGAEMPPFTPPVVSPSRQFGLDLLAQALLGVLVGERCHFLGWSRTARCWECARVREGGDVGGIQVAGEPGRGGQSMVAVVSEVTGRRAGAPELLTIEREAPACLGARVPPRPRHWS